MVQQQEEIEEKSKNNTVLVKYNKYIKSFLFRFLVKDRATNYTNAQRSLIVMQILLRVKFDETEKVNYWHTLIILQ